ncbi:MAG: hypothetical protein IKD04_09355 [Clostridia bacterium]|nr:hypothetical protein [Clostridia bacterium]
MKYYEVGFDVEKYLSDPDAKPGKPIEYEDISEEEACATVREYFTVRYNECFRQIDNENLQGPYIVPGGGHTGLWDWDAFFTSAAMDDDKLKYAKGSICNLLNHADEDGKPRVLILPERVVRGNCIGKPLQAQFAYLVAKRLNDFSWVEPYWDTLENIIKWFDENTMRNGYYVFTSMFASGIDNNPAVYARTPMGTAGCDQVSFLYRELCAMAKLSKILNKGREEYYIDRAKKLREFASERYFDQMDNFFYSIDVNYDVAVLGGPGHQAINWVTYLKFRHFSCLFPLWAGIATKEQAELVKNKIMDENEFLAPCGIRSESKADPIYNNTPMGDPSNFQGPVWGISTFLTAYGLLRYGYKDEAYSVAIRLVKQFARDIRQNGCVHEYYHGDTGHPLTRQHYMSWNILAMRIIDDIKNGTDSTTYDMLDID